MVVENVKGSDDLFVKILLEVDNLQEVFEDHP